MDYLTIASAYDQLVKDAANPANLSRMGEIGEKISEIENKALIAKEIIALDRQIKESELLTADPEMGKYANEELKELKSKRDVKLAELASLESAEGSEEDKRPAIIEFRPGAGGEEAKIWVNDLFRMYTRFADTIGLKYEALDEGTYLFTGRVNDPTLPPGPYGLFKWESGVHRVQRVPDTEAQGRIHTSTASVAVLPKVDPQKVNVREEELEWQFFRAGGHGGQNVNKVSTAVRLIHKPTDITVVSTQERYQERNRQICLDLLRSKLWEKQEEARLAQIDSQRKSAVGRGMRAEKIRTYNYPQNRVTDHRLGVSWHNLDMIIEGELADMIKTVTLEMSK